ncbi:uncharacterized protein LOC144303432 isoform X3 [Canis aureus]
MLEQGFSRTFVNVSGEQSHRWSAGCKSKAFQQIHGQRTAQRLRHKAFQTQSVSADPTPGAQKPISQQPTWKSNGRRDGHGDVGQLLQNIMRQDERGGV